MNKIVRNVRTMDVAAPGWLRGQRTRDEILRPMTTGKVLARGTIWTGLIEPAVDHFLDTVRPFTRGFVLNNIVGVEPSSATLDLGRIWDGLAQVGAAFNKAEPYDGADSVDLTAVRGSIEQFHAALQTEPFDATAFEKSLEQVKHAADAVGPRTGNFAQDSRAATRTALESFRTGALRLWGGPEAVTRDAALRDTLRTAARTTDSRAQISAINRAHQLYWQNRQ